MRLQNHIKQYFIPVILMAGMFVSCRNEMQEIEAVTGDLDHAMQTTLDVNYTYTEDGRIKNKLQAGKFERFIGEDSKIVLSKGFELEIYDSLGQKEASLKADDGIYYEAEGKIIARNNVIFKNVKKEEMRTEELIWLQDSDKVYTNKMVEVITDDGHIYGKSLITDQKFSYYKLKGITGDLEIKEETEP